jgi:hypothetical protein
MPSKTFSVEFETSGFATASSQMSSVSSDAEDAGDSMDEAGDSAEEAGDQMDDTGDSASSMGAKISDAGKVGAAGIAAITTTITGAVAGIGTLVTQTAQYARQVDRAAEQSGVSAEKIQEVAFAAEQVAGTDFDAVRDGMKELALRSQEAAMGTGEAKKAFDRLGISQQFLKQNSTAQIFSRVRQELQGASSKMRIMASEMIFGGEAGEKLVEVLGLSNKEMAAFASQARKTGSVLSSKQIAALENTRGAWRKLTSQVVGLGRQIGAMFAPLVTQKVIPALQSLAKSLRSTVQSLATMSATTKGTIALVTGLATAVSAGLAIWGAWPAIIAGVSAAFSGLATAATTAWAAVTSPITGVIAAVAAVAGVAGLIYDNWSGLSSFFSTLFSSISTSASAFGDVLFQKFALVWNRIEKLFAQAINALIDTVNSGLNALGAESYTIDTEVGIPSSAIASNRQRLAQAQSDLDSAMGGLSDTVSGSMSGAWDAVKQSTSDAVSFVESKIADLGSVFSLPAVGSSQGVEGGESAPAGGAGGSGQSGGEGEGQGQGAMSMGLLKFIRNLEPARQKTRQFKNVGKSATQAVGQGFNRITRSVGGAVSNLIQGKKAGLNFADTLTSALGSVISKLTQVVAKLAIIKSIGAIADISTGGITSIGGALTEAIPFLDVGGEILSDGVAKVHKGETVVPEGGAARAEQGVNVTVGGSLSVTMDELVFALDRNLRAKGKSGLL